MNVDEATRPLYLAAHVVMCRMSGECVPNHPLQHQLTRHAYPGQPATRAEHVTPRCQCVYLPPEWWLLEGCGAVMLYGSRFHIVPECPHHGHLAHRDVVRRMWDDPYGYGLLRDPYDMDDDKRKD